MSIYKDCDIRGRYGEELGEREALLIGRSCASLFPVSATTAVGGDVRISTPLLKQAVIEGLTGGGLAVYDLGTVPTPVFNFGVEILKAAGGIMVTASHNPPTYNGFKIAMGNLPLSTAELQEIERRVREMDFRVTPGPPVQCLNVLGEYINSLHSQLSLPGKPLRVVVDCGNGSLSNIAPDFLTSLGYTVIPLFCEPDGAFPNRSPNPSAPGALSALSRTVVQERAVVGIAFDGDGDRVVFVDDSGNVLPAEQVMIFFLRSRLPDRLRGEKFIYDLKSSRIVAQEVARLGGVSLVERSGYSFMKSRLIQENAFMAAEISGHYFFRELGRDDGLYAAAVFLAQLSSLNEPLSTITATYPQPHVSQDIRIPSRDYEDIFTVLDRSLPGVHITRLDGIRAEWSDGWALIRKSVTEPVYTLRFEVNHPDNLLQLVNRFLAPLPDMEKEVLEQIALSREAGE